MRSRALVWSGLLCVVLALVGGGAAVAAPSSAGTFELGGQTCDLIPVPAVLAATPVGFGACPGVRPGALVETDKGFCTMNFLFRGGDRRTYVGTAGHCILGESIFREEIGEQTWARGKGPVAYDSAGRRIGEFAYAILLSPKDFALIRLDPGVKFNPQMCHFGGPTAMFDKTVSGRLVTLHHYGNGLGVGDTVPARTHYTYGMPDPDHVYGWGAIIQGDSGAGLIDDRGRAIGVIVTNGLHGIGFGSGAIDGGTFGVTRIKPQVTRASAAMRISLRLLTAPRL